MNRFTKVTDNNEIACVLYFDPSATLRTGSAQQDTPFQACLSGCQVEADKRRLEPVERFKDKS